MTNRITRRGTLAVLGLALVGLVAAAPGQAGVDSNRTTQLTFSKPFSLPGVTLGAGTYIFERAAPQSAIEVVRVSSRDRRFVYYMGLDRKSTRLNSSHRDEHGSPLRLSVSPRSIVGSRLSRGREPGVRLPAQVDYFARVRRECFG